MRHVLLAHQLIGLQGTLKIVFVNTNTHTHEHLLRTLNNLSVHAEQVRTFKCFEPKVVVGEIAIVNQLRIQIFRIRLNDFVHIISNQWCFFARFWIDVFVQIRNSLREALFGTLVQVAHGNSCCKIRVVRMFDGH